MADDIITRLEITEKLLFPETDFWRNNYLNINSLLKKNYWSQYLFCEIQYLIREKSIGSDT